MQKNPIYDLVLRTFQAGNSPQKQYWDFTPTGDSAFVVSEFEHLFGTIIRETAMRRAGLLPLVSGLIARILSVLANPGQYALQKFTLPSDKEEYLFLRIRNHFYTIFKDKYGMTPNKYRQKKNRESS